MCVHTEWRLFVLHVAFITFTFWSFDANTHTSYRIYNFFSHHICHDCRFMFLMLCSVTMIPCLVLYFLISMPSCVSGPLSVSVVLPSVCSSVPPCSLLCAPPPRYHTWPPPSSLSSPVPRLVISVCVFSLCLPCTPCLSIASVHACCPHLLVFLPVLVLSVWFVLCLFLCTLLNYFILLLCLAVVLLLWFLSWIHLIKLASCFPVPLSHEILHLGPTPIS